MNADTTITPEDLLAHSPWLARLAARLVDPTTAEDLVQETWATAVRARPDRERPLRPWLGEVLRNLARMRARGQGRWLGRAQPLLAAAEAPLPTPEELLTFHEAQRLVAEAVARLEEPYRSTVLLCYAQEIGPAEIARRQNIPAGTVRWRLKRGLDQLRGDLDARYAHDRRAWCLTLSPLAARAGAAAPASAFGSGAATATATAGASLGAGALAGGAATRAALVGSATGRWLTLKPALGLAAAAALGATVLWFTQRPAEPPRAGAGAGVEVVRPARPSVPRFALAPGAPGGPGTPGGGPPGGGSPVAAVAAAAAPAAAPAVSAEEAAAVRAAIEPGDSPARGNPKAPVTMVVYSEFQCPFCARAAPTLRQLEAAYPGQLRIVWKHLPLPFHEAAGLAAEAALAAHEQGKFWEFHDRVFAAMDRLDPTTFEEHARALDLDVPRFRAALEGGKYRARVETDLKLAKEANITGTPTTFINGEKVAGALPLEAFKHKVETALARAKGLPPPPKPAAPTSTQPSPTRPGAPPHNVIFSNTLWPPPAIALPDALLGERLRGRLDTGKAALRGNPKAAVEVIYLVPGPLMGAASAQVDGLLAHYGDQVRVLGKAVALPDSPTDFAEAAAYASAKGKFWEFLAGWKQPAGPRLAPDRAQIQAVAAAIGLDADDLHLALEEGRFRGQVEEDREVIAAITSQRWPAFIVNGRVGEGPVAVAQLVDTALRRAGKRVPPRPASQRPLALPGQPGYRPSQLQGFLSPRQLFALEPRDDAWASAVEKELGGQVERDLRTLEPKLASSGFDCRTTLCRIRWRPGRGDPEALARGIPFLYRSMGPPAPGELYSSLRSELSQAAPASVAAFRSRRTMQLYNVRTGRVAKLPVPADRLPKE